MNKLYLKNKKIIKKIKKKEAGISDAGSPAYFSE